MLKDDLGGEKLPRLAKVASGFVVVVSCVVFTGWAVGILPLIRILPSAVAMHPLTAVVFICAGISLWRQVGSGERITGKRDGMAQALAVVVALAGALRLCDYAFNFPFHLEEVFISKSVAALSLRQPNEMAPNTAFNFLACGLALLMLDKELRKGICPGQWVILPAGLIALLALIGYSYNVLSLYRMGMANPMALETAICFAALCLGFMVARPRQGVMAVLTSKTTSGVLARRLIPAAILVPWVLGALLVLGEQKGLYGREYAISVFAIASIVIFTWLIVWNAELLSRTEERLRKTRAELERSNAELQEFASVASHDLSEPLRMVVSYLELLTDRTRGKLEPQAQEYIKSATDGAMRMQALIKDLLAFARVDARGAKFEPTDCEEAFRVAARNLKLAIEETRAAVSYEHLPTVMGDPVQLTQVFQNLVGNALKFHGNGEPKVDVEAHRQNGEWVFSVKDNGIGIDPKYFERIFVIFQRLHTRQEYPGTGMGLAICKRIIERHGGRLWVESEPGHGSTFLFTLPAIETGE
jgi:signal transduction histidine kinase